MDMTSTSLVHFLLDRGLLDAGDVVDGGLRVVESSRRHRSFRVEITRPGSDQVSGLFVKQARGGDSQAVATLQREGSCYWLAGHDPVFEPLADLAPRFVSFDRRENLLVVSLVPAAETLSQVFKRREGLDDAVADQLGERIGAFHRDVPRDRIEPRFEALFAGLPPWPLQLDQLPMEHFRAFGPGPASVVESAGRDPVLAGKSRELRGLWRQDCLMHGDLKWDNVLASRGGRLTVIDWELADVGDSLWDAAGLVQAHLLVWLWSMPLEAGLDPAKMVARSAAPIEQQRSALRSFWLSYRRARGFGAEEAEAALSKTLGFAAARLLQSAFERAVAVGQADAHSLFLLRAARNILVHPQNARRHLGLGEPASTPAGVQEAA